MNGQSREKKRIERHIAISHICSVFGCTESLLRRGVDVLVGTPGRILDHIERGNLKMNNIQYVILDEADEMLNIGFKDDIERLLKSIPKYFISSVLFLFASPIDLFSGIRRRFSRPMIFALSCEGRIVFLFVNMLLLCGLHSIFCRVQRSRSPDAPVQCDDSAVGEGRSETLLEANTQNCRSRRTRASANLTNGASFSPGSPLVATYRNCERSRQSVRYWEELHYLLRYKE